MLFGVVSSRSALSPSGDDDHRFVLLRSISHTEIERDELDRGIAEPSGGEWMSRTCSRRVCWQTTFQSGLTALGEIVSAGHREHGMPEAHHRGGYEAIVAAIGGGQSRGVRQVGVAVPGGGGYVGTLGTRAMRL